MDVPEFERAEYVTPYAADRAPEPPPPTFDHAAYMRALAFGAGAALIGSIIYAIVGIWIQLGYVAILVGGMVGTGMMNGSRGVSGRRYQVTSVLLTYFAVSLAGVMDALYHEAHRGVDVFTFATHHFVLLFVLVLIGPFLDLVGSVGSGLLGLLILFFGLQAAWRTAKGGNYIHLPQPKPGKPLGLLD